MLCFVIPVERPCKRCVSLNRSDSCYDIKHKKRGRPKLSEKRTPAKHQSSIVEMCSITPPPRIQDKKAPPRNIATKAPVAPGLACSSFTMTEQPGHQTPPETEDTRMITVRFSPDKVFFLCDSELESDLCCCYFLTTKRYS